MLRSESAAVAHTGARSGGESRQRRPFELAIPGTRTRRFRIWVHLALACFAGVFTCSAYHAGGSVAPSLIFLTALPVAVVASGGRRSALVWMGIGLAIYAAFLLADLRGHAFPDAAPYPLRAELWLTSTLAFLTLMIGQVASFDRTRHRALRELGEADRALRDARLRAEHAQHDRNEFLIHISHELRTPLTSVLGFTELALEHVGQESADPLRTLRREGRALLRTVEEVLDLTKIEAGSFALRPRAVRLGELAEGALELARASTDGAGATLVLEPTDALAASIQTDATRVQQILLRLIEGALGVGSSREIRLRVSRASATRVRFDVIVSGAEHAPELRGIGETISRNLTELLGGRLDVVHPPECGVVFRLELPAETRGAAAFVERFAPSSAAPPSSGDELAGCPVLVIDDSPDNLRLVRHFLARAGARVTCCENGDSGLDAVRKAELSGQPFRIVLLDIQMPHMDGHEVARLLRERDFRGAIVAFTAHAMATERERCLRSGFDDYITKPIDRAALVARIASHAAGSVERVSDLSEATPAGDAAARFTCWERFVRSCAPPGERSNPAALRRLGTLLSIGILGLPITLIQVILLWWLLPEPIARLCIATLVAFVPLQVLNVAIYRWRGSSHRAGSFFLAYICIEIGVVMYVSGGVASPATFWSVLVPLVGVALVGWRGAVIWTAVSMLQQVGFFVLEQGGVAIPNHIAPSVLPAAHVAGAAAVMVQVVMVMLAYAHGRADALKTLDAAHAWLEDTRTQAALAQRVKAAFLANVGQELRAPAAILVERAMRLGQGWQAEELELLETVRRSAHRLLSLADDFLDLSRLQAGALDVEARPCAPGEILQCALEPLRSRAESSGLRLELALDTRIPSSVRGDPARLQQVLRKLGENAIRFTRAGRVRASVGSAERRGAAWLCFRIADSGRGMSAEELSRVFEPFRQGDSSTARAYDGGGLGLALSRALVEALHGELEVESQPGRGSVFSVWLPWAPTTGATWVEALPAAPAARAHLA